MLGSILLHCLPLFCMDLRDRPGSLAVWNKWNSLFFSFLFQNWVAMLFQCFPQRYKKGGSGRKIEHLFVCFRLITAAAPGITFDVKPPHKWKLSSSCGQRFFRPQAALWGNGGGGVWLYNLLVWFVFGGIKPPNKDYSTGTPNWYYIKPKQINRTMIKKNKKKIKKNQFPLKWLSITWLKNKKIKK